MSKFDVTLINTKTPFDANKLDKRIDEIGGNSYKGGFEALDCDDEDHSDFINKVTLDLTASTMDLNCCCRDFEDKIKSKFGGKKGRK